MQIQCNCNFDPNCDIDELTDLFTTLHKLHPEIPDDPKKFKSLSDNSEKDTIIAQKKEIIDNLEKEKNEKEQEIVDLNNKIAQLSQEKKEFETNYNDLKSFVARQDEQIKSLNGKIENLQKKIEVYEPLSGCNMIDNIYFRIEQNSLEQTNSADAPFIGKVDINGKAFFQFNVEKGPHRDLVSNQNKYNTFCEIIDTIEDANHVAIAQWGIGSFNNGRLTVEEKSKIKLTRE